MWQFQDICPCRNLMAYSRKGINEQGDLWGNAIIDMQDYGVEDREELIRARNNPLRSRLKEALEGKEHCLVFFTSSHSWAPHQIGFQRWKKSQICLFEHTGKWNQLTLTEWHLSFYPILAAWDVQKRWLNVGVKLSAHQSVPKRTHYMSMWGSGRWE